MTNTDHSTAVSGAEDRVLVEQADRNFAADYGIRFGRFGELYRRAIEDGKWDDTDDVQLVSRHRLAALAQTPDRAGAVREAGEALQAAWDEAGEHLDNDLPPIIFTDAERDYLAHALLAATPSTPTISGEGEKLREAVFDQEPNIGATTNEPSLRTVLLGYYLPHFDPDEAERLTEAYIAALATPDAAPIDLNKPVETDEAHPRSVEKDPFDWPAGRGADAKYMGSFVKREPDGFTHQSALWDGQGVAITDGAPNLRNTPAPVIGAVEAEPVYLHDWAESGEAGCSKTLRSPRKR